MRWEALVYVALFSGGCAPVGDVEPSDSELPPVVDDEGVDLADLVDLIDLPDLSDDDDDAPTVYERPFQECVDEPAGPLTIRATLPLEPAPAEMSGVGLGLADFDADGYGDVVYPQVCDSTWCDQDILWGGPDGWTPGVVTTAEPDNHVFSVSVADFDADGLLDLSLHGVRSVRLLRNLGDRTFQDVTEEYGLETKVGFVFAGFWSDIDGNGLPDLYLAYHTGDADPHLGEPCIGDDVQSNWCNTPVASELHYNHGGAFVEDTGGPVGHGATMHVIAHDPDRDGDIDLLVMEDTPPFEFDSDDIHEDIFWERRDGDWVPHEDCNFNRTASMGGAVMGQDGDGLPSYWSSNIGPPRTMMLMPDTWECIETLSAFGVPDGQAGTNWTVLPIDIDGDAEQEVYISYGWIPPALRGGGGGGGDEGGDGDDGGGGGGGLEPQLSPDLLLSRMDDGYWPESMLSERPTWGAERWFGPDGRPIVITRPLEGSPELLSPGCSGSSRLVVHLDDRTTDNRRGLGARVYVGGAWRDVGANVGSGSGRTPFVSFSPGDVEQVDVLVEWLDGDVTEYTVTAHAEVTLLRN